MQVRDSGKVLEAPAMFPGPPKIGTLQSGSSSDSSSVSIFDRPSGPSQLLAVSTAKEKKEKKDKKQKPEAARVDADKIESALGPGAEAQEGREAAEAPEVEADHAEAWISETPAAEPGIDAEVEEVAVWQPETAAWSELPTEVGSQTPRRQY